MIASALLIMRSISTRFADGSGAGRAAVDAAAHFAAQRRRSNVGTDMLSCPLTEAGALVQREPTFSGSPAPGANQSARSTPSEHSSFA